MRAPRNCIDLNCSAFWRTNARSNSLRASGTPSLHFAEFVTRASLEAFVVAISLAIFISSSVSPLRAMLISLEVLPQSQHAASSAGVGAETGFGKENRTGRDA